MPKGNGTGTAGPDRTITEPPAARVVHAINGRLRLRVPDRRGDTAYFERAVQVLGAGAGVRGVRANPVTGSLLVVHEATTDAVTALGEAQGLFRVAPAPPQPPPVPPSTAFLAGLAGANRGILNTSGRRADLGSLLALPLLVGSLALVVRGTANVPALSLLWYAVGALSLGARLNDSTDSLPEPPSEEIDYGD
ncbi:MAG: hypothetical protein H6907_18430 [Hyphomicrobiales bacterium]|nr:hypothetical protein [Hyphomicrobiales bacterium]